MNDSIPKELGRFAKCPITGRKVKLVDGEKEFDEPGVSTGFIHFQDVETGEKTGFAGINWVRENLELLKGREEC